MSITLSIPILQEHNVCAEGQLQFRRKFTRSRTWETLEQFTQAFAQWHTLWNWDEAAEKFLGSTDEWESVKEKMEAEYGDDGENGDDNEWSYAQLGCVAWCKLYWERVNVVVDGVVSKAPDLAKSYVELLEKLEKARKFKNTAPARPSLIVELNGYYKGYDGPVMEYLRDECQKKFPQFVDEAIAHYEKLVAEARYQLHMQLDYEYPGTVHTYTLATLPDVLPPGVVKLSDVRDKEIIGVGRVDHTGLLHKYQPVKDSTALCGENKETTNDKRKAARRKA
jgi:hypothetical protein